MKIVTTLGLKMTDIIPSTGEQFHPTNHPTKDPELWALSQSLESSFLSEMLSSAGLGKAVGEFGGGIGEEQFSSFLNQTHADAMVAKGGIGLAESIYRSLAN